MRYNPKILLLGVITFLSFSALADKKHGQKSARLRRSFEFSNPIFSRVFNAYDNRPLAVKFFGYDYAPAPPQDGPQYYPLWYTQPFLNGAELVEKYPRREIPRYVPLSWMMEKPHTESIKPYPPATKPYPEASKPYPAPSNPQTTTSKPYPAPSEPHPITSTPCPTPSKPSPAPSKPYPVTSTPHPTTSKPYPAPSKPYPAPSKPYPAPSKPHSTTSKPYPAPSEPHPTTSTPCPAPSKPYPAPSKPHPVASTLHPTTSKPYPAPSKPYPAPSKPHSTTSKPYPAPSKPYPPTSKPYPAPSKPYPAASTPHSTTSKPYPAPSKPHSTTSKPYPVPSKPYPAVSNPHPESTGLITTSPCPKPYPEHEKPHQTPWKPVIGRIFVDEVDKNLRFEKNPETGELVPVITEGKKSTKNYNLNTFTNDQNEQKFNTHEPTEISHPTTTTVRKEEQERRYDFKLLPNYDIKTNFNSSTTKSTPGESSFDQIKNLPLDQVITQLKLEEKRREKERILWKLEMQRKFEEARKKILKSVYGEDESKWPATLSEAAVKVNKKTEVGQGSQDTTSTVRIQTQNTFKSLPNFDIRRKFVDEDEGLKFKSTTRPNFVLSNQEIYKVSQEVSPKVSCKHKHDENERIGPQIKTPCSSKTALRNSQNRFVQVNVPLATTSTTKQPSFYDVIVPHSTRNIADYSQFFAPPSTVIYQKFKKISSSAVGSSKTSTSSVHPTPTRKYQIILTPQNGQGITFQPTVQQISSVSPTRGLPFRVFKNKLDQSVLDSLKNGENGKIDTSKLDELTQTIFVEPVNRNDPKVREELKTLESAKFLDFLDNEDEETEAPFSTYGLPSRNFESPGFNSTFGIAPMVPRRGNNPQDYLNVGDIPLDEHKIWDSQDRVLINSYGEKTTTKWIKKK